MSTAAIVLYGFGCFACGIVIGYLKPKNKVTLREEKSYIEQKHTAATVTFNEPSDAKETFEKMKDLDDISDNFNQNG